MRRSRLCDRNHLVPVAQAAVTRPFGSGRGKSMVCVQPGPCVKFEFSNANFCQDSYLYLFVQQTCIRTGYLMQLQSMIFAQLIAKFAIITCLQ